MRLICPNCGAQYEVSADVIPENGRDVQCSNCGHTWFQSPEQQAAEAVDETVQGVFHDDDDTPVEIAATDDDAYGFNEPVPSAEPQRQPLPDDVSDILRQEAEYEAKRRAEESGGLESQPDLGIDETLEQREQESQARLARLKGENTAEIAAATAASRRDLLPDIEEINSSLRSSSDRGADDVQADQPQELERKRRSGFRSAFLFVILLAAIAALIYVFAPQIAERLPNLAEPLQAYVNWVNDLRLWLNENVSALMQRVTDLINGA